MKNLLVEWPEAQRPNVVLLEHDERFGVFDSEFVFYDYREPFKLPGKPVALHPANPSRRLGTGTCTTPQTDDSSWL